MPDDPRSDHDLLEAYKRGDPAAFDALYQRHKGWAVRVARRFVADGHEALDVLQDTFAHLVTRAPTLRLGVQMRSFLYPVIKHTALAASRKRRPQSAGADHLESEAPAAGSGDEPAGLAAALARLSEPHREVLLMRVIDELSLEEIGTALSIPLGTVKSRLHHALRALRDDPATRRYFLDE